MAFHRGPDIRTKNLVCCQDPHNHKNDYGSSVTKDVSGVRDSSGTIQYGALTNGAAYTGTGAQKVYNFDGTKLC